MANAYAWMAPHLVQHPAHPRSALFLCQHPPTHPPVRCNACDFPITSGFRYNYGSYNLHPYCAGIGPYLYIQHPHLPGPPHLFALIFSPPYLSGQFTCDICNYQGGSHWLYRCTVCNGFDAHLGCAIKAAQFQFHPAPYCPPLTPVYPPYNSGGRGAYASTPSSDRWIKIGNCNWVVGRLGGLGTAASLINIGSTLIETLNQLSGGGSILSF